jgi:hypothetical protein
MNSHEILDSRNKHKPLFRTDPETWEGKGTVHQIKWDDGHITSLYDYGNGESTHLNVVSVEYYEREFLPTWIPENKWRQANPLYRDRLLKGRSCPKEFSWYDAMLILKKVGVPWNFIQRISRGYYYVVDEISRLQSEGEAIIRSISINR